MQHAPEVHPRVLVARDTRISGQLLERLVAGPFRIEAIRARHLDAGSSLPDPYSETQPQGS